MTTLTDRILAALNDRKMSLVSLGIELKMKPGEVNRVLRGALEDLNRQKRLMIIGNEWTVTRRNSASDVTNGEKPEPELTDSRNGETDTNAKADRVLKRMLDTPPRPHRRTSGMKDRAKDQKYRIIALLAANGPTKAPEVLRLLNDESLAMKDVQNRLTAMRLAGIIEPSGKGYQLVSNTTADELDVKVTAPIVATAVQAPHTVRISTCGIDNPTPEVIAALREMAEAVAKHPNRFLDIGAMPLHDNEIDQARQMLINGATNEAKINIGVSPMCDIRAKLMEMADLVRDGKLQHDQVVDMIEILQYAAGIDKLVAEKAA